ncbi:hypothetical protein SEPCBS119000_002962 [Sporothrix epigloea]|uniref:Sialidase n=1 Tax=Sporothrix epigloea TaxID=1892477 RepID=A0ABP0DJ24_9PEZI
MPSTLAADVTYDFALSSYDCATPAPTVSFRSTSDVASSLEASFYSPLVNASSGNQDGLGHGQYNSQDSACPAISGNLQTLTATPDPYLLTPAVFGPIIRSSALGRPPIRKLGPLLLPKIRHQDQSLGGDASAESGTVVSEPKRIRLTPAQIAARSRPQRHRRPLVTQWQRHTEPTSAALSCHASSPPDSDTIASSNESLQQHADTLVPFFESTPPPPELQYFSFDFVPPYSQQTPFAQLQKQQQPESFIDQATATCSLDDAVVDDCSLSMHDKSNHEYSFAPYPGTVPLSHLPFDADNYHSHSSPQSQQQYPLFPVDLASLQPVAIPTLLAPSMSGPLLADNPTTSLATYLACANPAPALVRTISLPLSDPNTKYYWWDVRQIRPWYAFNMTKLAALPGASFVLTCPVPMSLLPQPQLSARSAQPETESELHDLCAAHYLPRLNAALCLSSARPIQLASSSVSAEFGKLFVGNTASESVVTAALFGGRPTARVVGLVKSFDRFNTGMRSEGNVQRVEYLRGLAHLHYVMREHSCRYGFLLTEIELVLVRSGTELTPFFGQLDVTSVSLAKLINEPVHKAAPNAANSGQIADETLSNVPLTACLALWGLCMLASDELANDSLVSSGNDLICPYMTHIGAPAEGSRQKAAPRDEWMPQPHLAEKRAAKRARGWILPEDAVRRKELGRRGVRYNNVR